MKKRERASSKFKRVTALQLEEGHEVTATNSREFRTKLSLTFSRPTTPTPSLTYKLILKPHYT